MPGPRRDRQVLGADRDREAAENDLLRIRDGTRLLMISVIRRANPSASRLKSIGKAQKLPQATARPSS